jgi:AraC-like DNA-binding protein
LHLIESPSSAGQNGQKHPAFLELLLNCLHQNFSDQAFGVVQMAQLLRLSRANLARKTLAATGYPPGKLLLIYRLNYSVRYLEMTTLYNVKQIYYLTGFSTQSVFYRSFHQQFGITPGEYRKSVTSAKPASSFQLNIPFSREMTDHILELISEDGWLRKVLYLILCDRASAACSVCDLCEALYTSAPSLFRKIKRALGVSPQQLISGIQLQHAGELLAKGERSLTEVAIESGFYDYAHFSKSFKSAFGVSPSKIDRKFFINQYLSEIKTCLLMKIEK